MRLALFTDTYEPEVNGVARTLGRWVDYLRRKGVPVQVFAPDPALGLPHGAAASVERFASLPFFLYPECRLALVNPVHIRRALHAFSPTLIHVATPFNLGLCGIHYARKYEIPLIASYHTHFDRYLPFYNLQWMVKMLWRYMNWFHYDCSRIFVPSASTKSDLLQRGWEEERLSIWPRGMDTKRFHPAVDRKGHLESHGIDSSNFIVLYVGRLAPEKNVDVALAAFAKFQRTACPEARLVVAGDGPSAISLKEQAEQHDIPVHFLGFTAGEELQKWYAASDIFLFPSPTETFGNVVLEAMACGTPVVTANRGGVTDTVEHGLTGFLCEQGDADAFCDALTELYENPLMRYRMASLALAYSRKQSWDDIFDRLLAECQLAACEGRSRIRHTK
ncbi:glycosyltransferase involved in cell wall biosynthesis [Paenibacillus phyllosphaerae]|uniref:Glycosyltransferase involved in cell wall biosynthesis n=1 Tax=Paenibacillus phyllosphaerae TaxID=274593 RepID=A0A7W5FL15_9BACL|nr:glycosyltransferase involved in cell wall biosynthesis [Paenibacillus phyllosphaerae]